MPEASTEVTGVFDVTRVFWTFVSDVVHMSTDDLEDAVSYQEMSEACNSELRLLVSEDCLVPIHEAALSMEQSPWADCITWNTEDRVYVFEDCNALFHGGLDMLRHSAAAPSPERCRLLEACVSRMTNSLETDDLCKVLSSLQMAI